MSFNVYKEIYRRFGFGALLHGLFVGVLNRLTYARAQVVYLIGAPVPAAAPGHEVRLLTTSDLHHCAGRPELDLSASVIEGALANGDRCFGAFRDGVLHAYAWFALRDVDYTNGLTARFGADYVHAYRNWTAPQARGGGVQKAIKAFAFGHFREMGRRGIVVAIDSQNFSSRRSTEGAGGKPVGYWFVARLGGRYFNLGTAGCRKVGYRLTPHADRQSSAPSFGLRVTLVENLEQLEKIAVPYTELLARSERGMGFFYQPGCMRAMAPLYLRGGRERLFFLLAWEGSQLLGLAPLQLERKSPLRGGLRRLHFWGGYPGSLNNMSTDLLCVAPQRMDDCVAAFRAFLDTVVRRRWDLLDLSYVPEQSAAHAPLLRRFPAMRQERESMETYLIDLPADFTAYCAGLAKKDLRDIRRCRDRLLENHPDARFRLATVLTEKERSSIADLHRNRQDSLRGRGVLRHSIFEIEAERQALWGLVSFAESQGQGRFYLLEIVDRLAAFAITFDFHGTLHFYLIAMDNGYGKYAPSKVLTLHLIQSEIEQFGTRLINTSAGRSKYKVELCNRTLQHWHMRAVNPALRSRLRHALFQAPNLTKSLLRSLIARVRSKPSSPSL